jgi:hypothetical protein
MLMTFSGCERINNSLGLVKPANVEIPEKPECAPPPGAFGGGGGGGGGGGRGGGGGGGCGGGGGGGAGPPPPPPAGLSGFSGISAFADDSPRLLFILSQPLKVINIKTNIK